MMCVSDYAIFFIGFLFNYYFSKFGGKDTTFPFTFSPCIFFPISYFPRHFHRCSSVPAARAAGERDLPKPQIAALTALSGVTKISPLRGESFFRNFQKYGAVPKSHAALRFLPLRNCVVSSVKKHELSEAARTE